IDGVVPKNRTLKPNESTTAEANYLVLEEDLPVLINEATARGWDNSGREANDTNSTRVDLIKVVFNKTPDLEMAHVGDRVNYGYDIINKGSTELHNLSIWDNKTGTFAPVRTTLGEGETTHANSVYSAKETDCPAVTNEAILYYLDRENKNRSISANASVPVSSCDTINISLSKKADKKLAEVGDKITYYYEIRNTGKVTLNNLTLNDSKMNEIVPKTRTLKPNESTTVEANYVVLERDLPVLINHATVWGWDNSEREANDTNSTRVDLIKVVFNKTPDLEMAHIGDRINYGYDIINKGSAELHNLSIWDNKTGNFTPARTTLGEGETTHANSVYTVKKTDCPAVINEAILYYQDRENKNRSISANASVPTIEKNSISLSKKANRTLAEVGDNITYYYEIRNTGKVTLNNLTLNDNKIGEIDLGIRTLKPNEFTTANATYVVLEEDLPVLINNATARGWDAGEREANDSDSARVDLVKVVFNKTPDRNQVCVGDAINYTFRIKNAGSVPITLLNLFDDLIGDIPINKTVLASNESLEAKAADRAEKAGYLNNTATLEFLDPDGRAGRATASASVDANCVTFLKEASVDTADVGQTIIYNFTIINKLSLPIKDLAITDGLTGPVHLDKNTLQTAETAKGTASYTVKSGDLPGPLVNKATFTAYDYWNEKITVYAAAKVILNSSDLQISKNGPKEPITTDDMINYAITVTNNGPSLARNVRVKDIVPANSILQSVTPSGYDQTTGIWSIGDLDKGQSFVMRMTLKPFSPGSVINAAGVYSETFDPYPANNESTAVVIVLPGPCGQNCFDCSASQTNYVNVTSHGQNIQVFSNGPATISNISQKMKNSANN
ncbi:MAG: DUF11 domain-containing protein, partial [Methanothrix sp.]|nr:DUF11 domain-containing protein [Methanothrix sp.]